VPPIVDPKKLNRYSGLTNPDASNLGQNLVSLNAFALKTIMSYMNTPVIAGVMIKVEEFKEIRGSDISEQIIIDNTGGRSRIEDNYAPRITIWEISGYIPCKEYEFSTYYITSLEREKAKIEKAMNSRKATRFKTQIGKWHDVLIEEFDTSRKGSIQNAIPFDMVLKEFVTQKSTKTVVDNVDSSSIASDGSKDGGFSSTDSANSFAVGDGKPTSVAFSISGLKAK
jgi:hypothetical protein